MILKPAQLAASLKQQLHPVYWISGDEPLLLLECADQIRQHCRHRDFVEREVFIVNKSFDWSAFTHSTGNFSLFSQKKLLELRFDSVPLDDDSKAALQSYMAAPNPDYVLLITSPRIETASMNSKWFKAIDPVVVQVWPVSPQELPAWLGQRLQQNGIKASAEAMQLLVEKVEGNLLAAVQEIEKLKLLIGAGPQEIVDLNAETVLQAVTDSSRFNVSNLIDTALAGDSQRVLKVLNGLRAEGVAPLAILGALCSELRRLLPMTKQVQSGQPISQVVEGNRVNFKRVQTVERALQRVRPALIFSLLDQARGVDYAVKGLSTGDPWIELEDILLRVGGTVTVTSRRAGQETSAQRV